jgi:hypothetical protein
MESMPPRLYLPAEEEEAFSMPETAQEAKDDAGVANGVNTKAPRPIPEKERATRRSTPDS